MILRLLAFLLEITVLPLRVLGFLKLNYSILIIFRWNFSVGQHELSFISDTADNCHQKSAVPAELSDDSELKVIVPEGLICSVDKSTGEIIWKHKVMEFVSSTS